VVMEAMSMGLPIIGSKAGGTTEQVEDGANGYLFEMKNPSDLASKIELFLNDDQKAAIFGARSRERMHKFFSLQLHEKNILELYNSI
jgi:glycosyltransferase involved in cell wall biosynthesis